MNSLCRMRCPISFIFLLLIDFIRLLLSFTSSSTLSFDFFSIHDVLVIFLHIHISIASDLCFSFLFKLHVSQPYSNYTPNEGFMNFFRVSVVRCLFVSKLYFFIKACLARAILLLTSCSYLFKLFSGSCFMRVEKTSVDEMKRFLVSNKKYTLCLMDFI
uniref:Uncharacterized protein n=1 Tax=Cacopsylla melanoneura TaxID=428564 RepID=A0A8D8VB27_9HEMI